MKIEEPTTEKIETKKFYHNTAEEEIFNLDNDLQIHEAKELVSQNAAILDFEYDGSGTPKSVTVTRLLDKKVIFYSKEERDIRKFLD